MWIWAKIVCVSYVYWNFLSSANFPEVTFTALVILLTNHYRCFLSPLIKKSSKWSFMLTLNFSQYVPLNTSFSEPGDSSCLPNLLCNLRKFKFFIIYCIYQLLNHILVLCRLIDTCHNTLIFSKRGNTNHL